MTEIKISPNIGRIVLCMFEKTTLNNPGQNSGVLSMRFSLHISYMCRVFDTSMFHISVERAVCCQGEECLSSVGGPAHQSIQSWRGTAVYLGAPKEST
jgi:hypothetical protein